MRPGGLALLVLALAGGATAPARAPDDSELRALVDPSRPDHLAGLQLAVVVDGAITELAYGRRFIHPTDRSRDLPMTKDTLLRVASASKPVTAVAVMQQVERRRLALDADVSRYLGFRLRNPRFPDVPITLRQLLSHTSSVVDGPGYSLPVGERLESFFVPGPRWDDGARFSAHAPGSFFEYSNLGWGVMGTILERVTGKRFDRLVAREVLGRARVEGAFDVASLDGPRRARLGVLYRKGPEEAPSWDPAGPWIAQFDDPRPPEAGGSGRWSAPGENPALARYRPGENGTLFSPQGGLRTSAGGLARLWSCLLGGHCGLLGPSSRAALLAPEWSYDPRSPNGDTWDGVFLSWGLGVQRFTGAHAPAEGRVDSPSARLDGRLLVGHLAEAYGLFGGVWFTPDGRYGLVYLSNGTATPFAANRGARSGLKRWEEIIVDWAAREAWRLPEAR